jgi:hypothetical protein
MSPYPTRQVVQNLAEQISHGGVDLAPALDEALHRADADGVCGLLLAAAVAGRSPDASQVATVLPDLTDVELFPILVGACTGDRVAMLLDLVEAGRASDERDALALFLAVELVSGTAPSPRLTGLLRTHVRRRLGVEASILLALAATRLGDPDVLEVAKAWLPMATVVEAKPLQERLRRQLSAPTLSVLREHAPARVISGFTVRRPVPKVGRNDPCSCGSGKKYKKCCAERDAERASDPSPLPGLTRAEYLRSAGPRMTSDEIDGLRPYELAQIDPTTLATGPLISALRRASAFRRWDLAERTMEALAGRSDAPGGDGEAYREELISDAVDAGNTEVADRQIALLPEGKAARASDLLKLELLRPTAETLAHLERTALAGLREPNGDGLFDLAFSLLQASPALGIVVARGSLSAHRWLDSATIIDVVEEARDRLGLPPGDSGRDLFELLLDRDTAGRVDHALRRGDSAERGGLAAQAEDLQDKLKESRTRVADLERRLRAQEASLGQLQPDRPAQVRVEVVTTAATPPWSDDGGERRRLRAKVDELKHLLTERNEERKVLRKQLAKVNDALVAESPDVERAGETDEAEPGDAATVEQPRSLLVPSFAPSCRDDLRDLPALVARRALATVASLAGADVAAWRQVKRMASAADPLLTCRVGIHHRVVFRVAGGELAVLSMVHRKDLDGAIKRHGRIVSR